MDHCQGFRIQNIRGGYVLSERVVIQVIRVRQVDALYAQFPFPVAGTTWALSDTTRRLKTIHNPFCTLICYTARKLKHAI